MLLFIVFLIFFSCEVFCVNEDYSIYAPKTFKPVVRQLETEEIWEESLVGSFARNNRTEEYKKLKEFAPIPFIFSEDVLCKNLILSTVNTLETTSETEARAQVAPDKEVQTVRSVLTDKTNDTTKSARSRKLSPVKIFKISEEEKKKRKAIKRL